MGPVAMTTVSSIHSIQDALDTSTFEGGPTTPLGQCVGFPGSDSDTTICYVRPVGHANAGDVVFGPHADPATVNAELNAAVPTLEQVILPGNAGGQVWMYVKAGEALVRGEAVCVEIGAMFDPSAETWFAEAYTVVSALVASTAQGGAGVVVGVAQWNIPNEDYGWILVSGPGFVLAGDTLVAGDLVDVDAVAGEADPLAAAGQPAFARVLDAASAGDLVEALINCPG